MAATPETIEKQRQVLAAGRKKVREAREARAAQPLAAQSNATLREMRFAMYYIETLNKRESAIRAGYSPKDADQRAWRLVRRPRVRALIERLQERFSRDMRIETEQVLREYANVGFVNVADFIDSEGRIDLSKVGREQLAAVSSIETETYVDGKGEDAQEVKRVKLRFHSKTDALEALSKHLGLFERDNLQRQVQAQIVIFANNPVAAGAVVAASDVGAEHDVIDE